MREHGSVCSWTEKWRRTHETQVCARRQEGLKTGRERMRPRTQAVRIFRQGLGEALRLAWSAEPP